jgi:hypothetical protein
MAGAAKQKKVDDLVEKVSESLRRGLVFEAERMAEKALAMAKQEQDFLRMASIIDPLWEARRERFRQAIEHRTPAGRTITVISQAFSEEMKIKPGCYLVQPPQVGAEARRLRLAAIQQEIPVAVLCREPKTRAGLVPVVAISPGSTLRVRIQGPADLERVDLEWFLDALEALGDWAVESIDPEMLPSRAVDALLDYLDALPEHENLHRALQVACRKAHETRDIEKPVASKSPAAISKTKIQF